MIKESNNIHILVTSTIFLFGLMWILFTLNACTLSIQNISTKGSASDLIDENQDATPHIETHIDNPFLANND